MTVEEARAMVEERSVSTGMIPKLSSCLTALDAGVMRAHIVNGTIPHALLLELLTDKGIGTMITRPSLPGSFTSRRSVTSPRSSSRAANRSLSCWKPS